MIPGVADHIITIYRQTAFVLDAAAAAASMSPDRQPSTGSLILGRVYAGTSNTGSATISGTVGGSADTEELTWTGAGSRRGKKLFTALSGITTSGLADESTVPTISLQAVDQQGSPTSIRYQLPNAIKLHASVTPRSTGGRAGGSNVFTDQPGSKELDAAIVALDFSEVFTPQGGDLVVEVDPLTGEETADQWFVGGVRTLRSGYVPHHFELICNRYQT